MTPDNARTMTFVAFDEVDSTNELARRMVLAGKIASPTCLTARVQTAGKGTRGRRWLSPRDAGIYLSVVQPGVVFDLARAPELTIAAGVACVSVLQSETNLPIGIKPVNDLVIDRRKIGGILTEVLAEAGANRAVITGIGINVSQADRPMPASDANRPIDLQSLMGPIRFAELSVEMLTQRLATEVARWNERVFSGQIDHVRRAWQPLVVRDS